MAAMAILAPLLGCLLLASSAMATLEDVCKTIAAQDTRVEYGFCMSSLGSAPGSSNADNVRLAAIAADLAVKEGNAVLAKIEQLSKNLSKPAMARPLQSCQGLYSDTTAVVGNAIGALDVRNIVYAKSCFSATVSVPLECELGFAKVSVQSPLSTENVDMIQLLAIGLNLTQ